MNPLLGAMSQNSPINQILKMANGGVNPQQIIDGIVKQNPQAGQLISQMRQSNQNPKDYVMNYLQKQGTDMGQVQELISKLGIK